MATPTMIPIKGDCKTHSGPLGIVKVYQARSTELEALHPRREGKYNPRDPHSFILIPPTYEMVDKDSGEITTHFKVWCPSCARKGESLDDCYQRREAFYKDNTRPNGLEWQCKTCSNEARAGRARRQRLRVRVAAA